MGGNWSQRVLSSIGPDVPSEKPMLIYKNESKNVDKLVLLWMMKVLRLYRRDADVGSSTNAKTQKKEIES